MTAKTCANFSASSSTRWMKWRNASKKRPWPDDGVRERVARDAGRSPLVLRLVGHRVSSRLVSSALQAFLKTSLNSRWTTHRTSLRVGSACRPRPWRAWPGSALEELQRPSLHRAINQHVHPARECVVARAHAEGGEQLPQHRFGGDEAADIGMAAGDVGERLSWCGGAGQVRL